MEIGEVAEACAGEQQIFLFLFFIFNRKCIDYASVYSNITTVSLSDYSFEYCDVIDLNLLN